ncbi:MAG: carbonic anhydrase, partial [Candidatus Eisenbacteria bacterium]|nr:carbonic anhydrase [Candidatus Eisenbacteria bacterium]
MRGSKGAGMPIRRLIDGNRGFRERFAQEQEFYLALARDGQRPRVLWIGCSDSRVVPEQITGARAGELFVVRNVANIVPPAKSACSGAGAVIEYGVLHLQVNHIIVCGHTDCGGIRALATGIDAGREPHIAEWLAQVRPIWEATG